MAIDRKTALERLQSQLRVGAPSSVRVQVQVFLLSLLWQVVLI